MSQLASWFVYLVMSQSASWIVYLVMSQSASWIVIRTRYVHTCSDSEVWLCPKCLCELQYFLTSLHNLT